jgi:ice-binding like protein
MALNARLAYLIPLAASLLASAPSSAASLTSLVAAAPSVGAAGNFAVLAGTAVTCTNGTITGNVGVSPGTAITQTSCPVTGTINAGNAAAVQANSDFFIAYDKFKALACDRTLTTFDSQTLSPGVYCVDAAATFTDAVLTLAGPANGLWIFKIGTLGTGALTGTRFSVVTPSGAPPCNNVYWWVAEAATMTDSTFVGTILAGAAVSLTRGTFNGDAFAKAAVTITGTAVTACAIGSASPSPSCKDRDKDKCKCECKDKKHDDCDDDDDDHDGDNHHRKHEEYRR